MIKGTNVTIKVSDLNLSISFYQSIGFKLINRWGEHYAQLTATDVVIGLHPSKEISSHGNVSIGFTIDNFDEIGAILTDFSIQYSERIEEGGQFIHFNDPDGTPLYFINPRKG